MTSELPLGSPPPDWSLARLEELADFITKGATPTTHGFEWAKQGILFLRSECVSDRGFRLEGSQFISSEAHHALARSAIRGGDLLVTITGNVGRIALFPERLPEANINQHIARVRVANRTQVEPRFLVQVLGNAKYRRYFERIVTGLAYPQISLAQVRDTPVPLPPLWEQGKIAGILASVDEAIEATQAVIEQLQVVKKAMMAELLTRGLPGRHTRFKQTEIGEVPEEWDVRSLADVATWQNGKAFPSADYSPSGVRLVRPGNLAVGGVVMWDQKHTTHLPAKYAQENPSFLVSPGELLMNLTAQSLDDQFLGRVCLTPAGPQCLLNQRIARIVPKGVDSRYLQWALSGPQFRAHVDRIPKGSKVQHIYNGDLESARIPVPSMEEQRSISGLLDLVRDRCAAEEETCESLGVVKRALMSVLLTGEVRVKPDPEPA